MTKDEILDALEDEREKLMEAIDGLSDEALQEVGAVGEWSVKDVLVHISMWEAEMDRILWQAAQGQKPTTMHFRQISVDETNAAWQKLGAERSWEQVMDDFWAVRKQTIKRLEAFSDEDLNNLQRYPWQSGKPLWEWVENDSYGHENEHRLQIEEWRKKRGL